MLKIEKNKILYFPYNESRRFRNLTTIKGGIFGKMNDYVEISENVTFADFFNLLIKEKQHISFIFGASLYGVSFDLLIKDFKKKIKPKDDEIQYLEIYWYVDYDDEELCIKPEFHGIGIVDYNDTTDTKGSIALDFTPIYVLKNYPLKLNRNLEIIDKSKPLDENRTVLKTTKQFTLFEIIHSVLYELTWYGTPEKRDNEALNTLGKNVCNF